MIIVRNLAEFIEDAQEHFYDRKVLYFPKKHFCMSYPDDLLDTLVDEDEEYHQIVVPSFSNEMYISFFKSLDQELFEECMVVFQGQGKYRRIKDFLSLKNKIDAFYQYKDEYCFNMAKKYCIDNNIPYDDTTINYE
ncbi:MAG: hypothetical protein K9L64_06910 [Candidatus Izimaplasma sp.]|nr:hypothetical protein [Candidatus Izimaplasma bacterium]